MSQGRIARAHRRYPDARRRAERYGQALRARRSVGLPPHLLPGVSGRQAKKGIGYGRVLVAGTLLALLLMLGGIATFVASTAASVGGTVAAYRKVNASLPNAAGVAATTFQTTRITDRNGVLLQEVDQPKGGWRTFAPLDKISPYVIDATVAAEDATFWSHYGVEPLAIVRGLLINASGSGSSGGSTITQQLARGLYPDQIGTDVTISRKFKEALAAVAIDHDFSKQDILTMYLNQIFYGQRSYGIEAAAETYFNKKASELTLGEASLLAGLPQAPSFYDPTVRPDQAKKRQQYVLDQMVKYKYITAKQAKTAKNELLHFNRRDGTILHAPHFTSYVRDYIAEHYGKDALYKGGLQITTTIDTQLQERAEAIVQQNVLDVLLPNGRNNAAMVVMLPWSGEILAMVGSADFTNNDIGGQVNYAVAGLQPGSSIKPVVYAAAFESGWNPATVVLDTTMKEPDQGSPTGYYEPQNYTGQSYGAVSVRTALSNSLNIPAVKAIKYAGIDHMIEVAGRMGIKHTDLKKNYGLALALGSGDVQLVEHTNVFATLANEGKYVPANPILKITDSQGNLIYDIDRGHTLERAPQALKPEYAYQIATILTDNDARSMIFGPNNLFGNTQEALGRPTAAKSGTTNGWKDIWTMGFTTDVAIGVWTGQTTSSGDRQNDLPPFDGIQGAGPIWSTMMKEMHSDSWSKLLLGPDGQPLAKDFPVPAGVEKRPICASTGHQATDGFESRTEWLVKGEGPSLRCDQLSAYEQNELQYALQDVRENGGKYTGRGVDSISRYASAVGALRGGSQINNTSPPIQPRQGG